MDFEQLKYRIALTMIPGIGAVKAKSLVSYCGGVKEIFKCKKARLLKVPEIGSILADQIIGFKGINRAEAEAKFVIKQGINPLFFLDELYPKRLKECYDSPIMLFLKGEANLNAHKAISIVGTRKCTAYGKEFCRNFIDELSGVSDLLVISGLAYGIDIEAHKNCLLKTIPTVGVVAHGLDTIYPSVHRKYTEKMIVQGGLLTEYTSSTYPRSEYFPARNRIIAGLSDAVVVVEAGEKGGALITAEFANGYNKEVFAVPGRVNDPFSKGCHRLIREHKAALCTSAAELITMMSWDVKPHPKNDQLALPLQLSEEENRIQKVLYEHGTLSVDNIAMLSNYPISRLNSLLLGLEFKNVVQSLPGKMYSLL